MAAIIHKQVFLTVVFFLVLIDDTNSRAATSPRTPVCTLTVDDGNKTRTLTLGKECCTETSFLLASSNEVNCYSVQYIPRFMDRPTWYEARRRCEQTGGILATITNNDVKKELDVTLSNIQVTGDSLGEEFWIGLHRDNAAMPFKWVDGKNMTFRYWAPYNPVARDECAAVSHVVVPLGQGRSGARGYMNKWQSSSCVSQKHYICQYNLLKASGFLSPVIEMPTLSIPTTTAHYAMSCDMKASHGLIWPKTPIGHWAVKPCPLGMVGEAQWYCQPSGIFAPGGPDLTECRQPWIAQAEGNLTKGVPPSSVLRVMTEKVANNATFYTGDLAAVGNLALTLVSTQEKFIQNVSKETRSILMEDFTNDLVYVSSGMLRADLLQTWQRLPQETKTMSANKLTESVETSAFTLAETMREDMKHVTTDNIFLEIHRHSIYSVETFQNNQLRFPAHQNDPESGHNYLQVPFDSISRTADSDGQFKIVFSIYKNLNQLLNSVNVDNIQQLRSRTTVSTEDVKMEVPAPGVNSHVIAATVEGASSDFYFLDGEGVTIVMEHLESGNHSSSICVFWNQSLEIPSWSDAGCKKLSSNRTHTVCFCDHLTNFAVLMDIGGNHESLPEPHKVALSVLTYAGCIISIICLFFCIITFSIFRALRCVRNTIHRNLCICLFWAELLFIVGIDKTQSKLVCGVIAGCLHYLFLSAFMWMCLEGIQLYLLLVEVFDTKKCRSVYLYLLGYGIPAVIVAISVAARPGGYGTLVSCWLSTENYLILSFVLPVCVVLLVNSVFLVTAMRVVVSHNKEQKNTSKVRIWTKGAAVLMCILGLTWIFGFLYVTNALVVFSYIFTVLNSAQGLFIFIFHCAMNDSVQKQYKRLISRSNWLPDNIKRRYGEPLAYTPTTSSRNGTIPTNLDSKKNRYYPTPTHSMANEV